MKTHVENVLLLEQLFDLRKSGLADQTIISAKIEKISVADLQHVFDGKLPSGIESAYSLPFLHTQCFERFRVFYKLNSGLDLDGKKKAKYLQVANSPNSLYLPPKVIPVLKDPTVDLWCTEGEKKALWGSQEGLPTFAITGLWNWCKKGTKDLIDDFNLISLQGRKVIIVPDSDWQTPDKHGNPKNLDQAVYGLCRALQSRGAKTFIKDLSKLGGHHGDQI
jgi:hypothetical protein